MKYKANTAISTYDFLDKFPDEKAARAYLEQKRWANGMVCPRCNSTKISKWKSNDGWCKCNNCKKQFNVKTCTIFEKSKIPLHKWLLAFYKIVTARKGISSMQISKELGITQKSAWFMLHRVREAMKSGKENYIFSGVVECDETYIGGKKHNKHWDKKLIEGRGAVGKTPIFGMVERKGTVINTDEWKSYIGLGKDYTHLTVKHKIGQYKNGLACTNTIESAWAVLKRGYGGIYHYMSPKHLQRYADEFDFRYNEGNVKFSTMDRVNSLVAGCWGARLTWRELVEYHSLQC